MSHTIDENKVYYNPYVKPVQQNNEIWYTSTDGNVVSFGFVRDSNTEEEISVKAYLYNGSSKLLIESNTYENGIGILRCNNDITEIGTQYFGYAKISSVILPPTITKIDALAFASYNPLALIIQSTTPLDYDHIFSPYQGALTIYVPDEFVNTYKEANGWSEYVSKIKPISEKE